MGGGGATWIGTCISLCTWAALLTLASGQIQRNRALELATRVRLVGGIDEREGVVELTYSGQRGKLCGRGITNNDVAILCRMLGFEANGVQTYRLLREDQRRDLFGQNPSDLELYILYGLECNRLTDNVIADCNFEPGVEWFNPVGCTNNADDVGIQCFGDVLSGPTRPPVTQPTRPTVPSRIPTICNTPSLNVRLRGGASALEGRVEVRRPDGSFGGVCDNGWGVADAQVICRMLCYDPRFSQARINIYGNSEVPFYLTDLDCEGIESDILDCSATIADVDSCTLNEAASVSCFEDLPVTPAPPAPVVECRNSRITARFSRELEPRLRVEYLTLENGVAPDCGYTESIDANFVTISIPFVGCGTSKEKTNSTHITYSNVLRHAIPPDSSIITRSTIYNIEVTCVLSRDSFPDRNIEPDARTATPVDGSGNFLVDLELFRNNEFAQPIRAFPARVTLGDFLYVGLSLRSADRALRLIVPECKATADEDRNSQPQYYFIDQKCRVEDSVIFYSFNETFFAFRFQTFKFVGDRPFVYIHCTSYVCTDDEGDQDCDRSCNIEDLSRGKRSVDVRSSRRRRAIMTRSLYDSDRGPIEFLDGQGNLITLERELQKPRPILTRNAGSGGSRPSACVILICITHLIRRLLLLP